MLFGAVLVAQSALGAWAATYPETVLAQRPVGYWRLEETATPPGPVRPRPAVNQGSTGTTNNGLYLLGALPGGPGALGGAGNSSTRFSNPTLNVGYGGSKVEVPYDVALNPQSAFTVEFWAKPSLVVTDLFCPVASIDSADAIGVGPDPNPRAGWIFYQRGNTNGTPTQWQFRMGNAHDYLDGDAVVGGTATVGAWHHVVGVYDGTTASLYVNGAVVASRAIDGYQANRARPLRIGTSCFQGELGGPGEFSGNRGFDGWLQEVAMYGTALSAGEIAAHYSLGQTNSAGYTAAVLAQNPLGYWRLGEAGDPPALNLGTLGTNGNGRYVYPANPGQAGPVAPSFAGLGADNRSCGFRGTNGLVELPALNLHTNTVTMTAWVFADGVQPNDGRIVFAHAGTTMAGLKFDVNDPNGLSYDWNNDSAAANFKSSLPVPDSRWAFVALIVKPEEAVLCLQDGTTFSTATNYTYHPEQSFEDVTLIGGDVQDTTLTFNGRIDEVAVFDRALGVGEVYSQYATAVGGLKPAIFGDVQAPADAVYAGDTLVLSVDAGGTAPMGYQWRKDGNPIPGATGNVLTQADVTAIDSASYDVVITNALGTVTSQKARISVLPLEAPAISQDPQGRTVYAGGTIALKVVATGGGLRYQWKRNGTAIAGATNASYVVTGATNTDAGTYVVSVANKLGTVTSASAAIQVILPTSGSYEATIVADRPEAWWRLDDEPGSTVLLDAMGRHDGVYKGQVGLGATGVLAGNTNAAASFDGGSGYGEVPYSKELNPASFTLECWVRANAILPMMTPVGSFTQPPGRGYMLAKLWDGLWGYFYGNGVDRAIYYVSGSDALYSEWVQLAITYQDGRLIAYLNGSFDTYIDDILVPNNVAPLRIGLDQNADGWNGYWNGEIDEVTFYSKALTSDQIAAHYVAALYGSSQAPVFTQQPESRSAVQGTNVYFGPTVWGTLPLTYQWSKNGLPLAGETNFDLVVSNVSFNDIGAYVLTVSNSVGVASSSPAVLTVLPPPTFAGVTNGLVLHLAFEKDYQDSSGRGNHGQPVGTPRFVAGVVGSSALHYSTFVDNSDPENVTVVATNYVTLGDCADLRFGTNIDFSVSYWVRFRGSPGDLPFLCNTLNAYGQPGFTFAPSYQLGGWSWSLESLGSSDYLGIYGVDDTINDNKWHHLVHTFDRTGSGTTYLDGRWADSRSIAPIGDLNIGNPVNIGQDASGGYPEEGQADLDDLAVWHRVLSRYEIYSIYTVGLAGKSFDTFGPVTLTLQRGGGLQLVWPAGTLLEARSLDGPWTAVPQATAPYFKVVPGVENKFYRVQL